MPLRPFGRGDG